MFALMCIFSRPLKVLTSLLTSSAFDDKEGKVHHKLQTRLRYRDHTGKTGLSSVGVFVSVWTFTRCVEFQ